MAGLTGGRGSGMMFARHEMARYTARSGHCVRPGTAQTGRNGPFRLKMGEFRQIFTESLVNGQLWHAGCKYPVSGGQIGENPTME